MSVSKLWRVVGVSAFVAAGYVGCTCNPPPNNPPPSGGACINPGQERISWAFQDQTCGCKPGDAKCAYESRVMSCFRTSEVPNYDCARLPEIHRAKDDKGHSWEVLDLETLQAPRPSLLRLRDCIEKVNRDPGNNSCPAGGGTPVGGHLLNRCEGPSATSSRIAPLAVRDAGQDECGSEQCLLPSNVWNECGSEQCCLPDAGAAPTK